MTCKEQQALWRLRQHARQALHCHRGRPRLHLVLHDGSKSHLSTETPHGKNCSPLEDQSVYPHVETRTNPYFVRTRVRMRDWNPLAGMGLRLDCSGSLLFWHSLRYADRQSVRVRAHC